MQYKDYYDILGVQRSAPAEEIRRAYRNLARKYHPDVSKGAKGSEEKFKEINEAYEVLKDADKRKQYDALGANWKSGQDFRPPNGFEGFGGAGGGGQRHGFNFGQFSDFFEALFGGAGGPKAAPGQRVQFRNMSGGGDGFAGGDFGFDQDVRPVELDLEVPVNFVIDGGALSITLSLPERGRRSFDVRIPKGIAEGKKIRLAGEGPGGADVLLKVRHVATKEYRIESGNLVTDARITPGQAFKGTKTAVHTPGGEVSVTVPAKSNSGRRLRLKGKGLPAADGSVGDLYVQLMIVLPEAPTPEQERLYMELGNLEA